MATVAQRTPFSWEGVDRSEPIGLLEKTLGGLPDERPPERLARERRGKRDDHAGRRGDAGADLAVEDLAQHSNVRRKGRRGFRGQTEAFSAPFWLPEDVRRTRLIVKMQASRARREDQAQAA